MFDYKTDGLIPKCDANINVWKEGSTKLNNLVLSPMKTKIFYFK